MRGDRCRSAPRRPQIFYTAARDCGRASRVSHPPIPEKKCRPMCAQRPCAKQSDPTSRTRTDTPKCLARPAHKHDQTNAKKTAYVPCMHVCWFFSQRHIRTRILAWVLERTHKKAKSFVISRFWTQMALAHCAILRTAAKRSMHAWRQTHTGTAPTAPAPTAPVQ